jgi:hypothetical protein
MARTLCYCGRLPPCAQHPRVLRRRPNPLKDTAAWRRARQTALYRDGHRCSQCGSPATAYDALHVHHLVPRSEGGTDALGNLVTLYAPCAIREWSGRVEREMGGGGTSPRVRKPLRRLRVGRVPAPGELEPTAAVRLRRRTGRRAFSVARFFEGGRPDTEPVFREGK